MTIETDYVRFATADPAVIERLGRLCATNIGDGMDRLGLLDSGIQAVWSGATVVGSAFTVWTRPGDNLAIHKALEVAGEGDVLVVNGHGDISRALIGELIGVRARAKRIAGFVIDGAVRDASGLKAYKVPVFARAVTPAGPYKDGPGRLNVPVACGGIAVLPGDVIIGDGDGVAVIPRDRAPKVAAAAEVVQACEKDRRRQYEADLTETGAE